MKWLVIAMLVIAGCAKKSGPCEGARQIANEAITTAQIAIATQVEASLVVEAKLAQQKVDLAGAPAPPELSRKRDEASVKTAELKLRIATLDHWRATLGANTPAPLSPTPERDEPAEMTTARTLMIAYAAECAP